MPKCRNCKQKFEYKYNSFEKFCLEKDECIKAFAEYVKEQKEKQRAKKWKKEKKVLKEKLKTLSQYEADAKKEFQHFIRLRDKNLPCISCGANNTTYHGGHFYKAEIYSGLIFDERNCHKQCAKCNTYLGGNENNYRLGLIDRKGIKFVLQLDADAIKLRDYKYTKEQLIEIKNHYKEKVKELLNEK